MVDSKPLTRLSEESLDLILCYILDFPVEHRSSNAPCGIAEELRTETPVTRDKALSFRLVERRFNNIYIRRFRPPATYFHTLPRSALDKVLDIILGEAGEQLCFKKTQTSGSPSPMSSTYPQYLNLDTSRLSTLLPPDTLLDVLNFRSVNRSLNQTYNLRFGQRPAIFTLPSEIHDIILGYLVNVNTDGKLMPTEKKASLSVESFALQLPSQEDASLTATYRLVCRQFARRALRCQFTRVWVRFSKEGFDRLRFVAEQPHLAKTVRQFSYMIPRFYFQETLIFEEITRRTNSTIKRLQMEISQKQGMSENGQRPTISQLQSKLLKATENANQVLRTMAKAKEQSLIVTQRQDYNNLRFALTTFSNLEQIRFMKVMDQVDVGWINVIEQHPDFRERLNAEWNLACEHSAKTLTEALILSNARNFQRLSSRFMDPATPLSLSGESSGAISKVAQRLRSLELEFDNRWNLDEKVKELSALFRLVFAEAQALENLHIGFRRLVSVPIGTIFHDIKLENLSYLGLHQWELESQELVDLLLRYRHIRYLRLRYIRLRRGSWARVLRAIRLNLTLSWISLRGISYPGDIPHPIGIPMALGHGPDDSSDDSDSDSWTGSDSDDDDEDTSDEESEDSRDDSEQSDTDEENSHSSEDGDDEGDDESDDEASVMGNGIHTGSLPNASILLPPPLSPGLNNNNTSNIHSGTNHHRRRTSHVGQCHCYNGYAWDKIDDNRESVLESQWKRWQKWVLKPCRLHDGEAARIESESESDLESGRENE